MASADLLNGKEQKFTTPARRDPERADTLSGTGKKDFSGLFIKDQGVSVFIRPPCRRARVVKSRRKRQSLKRVALLVGTRTLDREGRTFRR